MPNPPADLAAALAAARANGADGADPVGWHVVEALARRAQAHGGAARADIERRVAARLAALRCREPVTPAAPDIASAMPPVSPLAALRALATPSPRGDGAPVPDRTEAAPELKALRDFRQRWQQLQAEHWLDQSLASAPDKAGPLNSHALAVRTLKTAHALSPAYVAHLLVQLDALRWLEPTAEERAPRVSARPARPAGGR